MAKPTTITNADRLDWDEPTFINGDPCSRDGCTKPADGFLIAPDGTVEPGGVCKQHGNEAGVGEFEHGIIYRDWQTGRLIKGIPVRRKLSVRYHIGLGNINRTYCGRDTKRLKIISVSEFLKSEWPNVCRPCARGARNKVVII